MSFERINKRQANALRSVKMVSGVIEHAPGSVEISFGKTRVICTASIEERVPHHALERGIGWVTAEYGMLPGSTHTRSTREVSKGKPSGRSQEIQRLIGRSLRSIVDLKSLQGYSLWMDCDVIQADGGTRTASITGAYVAMIMAMKKLQKKHAWPRLPVLEGIAAISVGIVGGQALLDLDYGEDSHAEVDMNLVMTESNRIVEIQATAEGSPFSLSQLDEMKGLGGKGILELIEVQKRCISEL